MVNSNLRAISMKVLGEPHFFENKENPKSGSELIINSLSLVTTDSGTVSCVESYITGKDKISEFLPPRHLSFASSCSTKLVVEALIFEKERMVEMTSDKEGKLLVVK